LSWLEILEVVGGGLIGLSWLEILEEVGGGLICLSWLELSVPDWRGVNIAEGNWS
jgi:hypothetical protein